MVEYIYTSETKLDAIADDAPQKLRKKVAAVSGSARGG
jgi:hypothetical protein